LVGLLPGLQLIKTEKQGRTSFALEADNQAALSVVATPSNKLGYYLANIFLTMASNIGKNRGTANYSLTLRWTMGHVKTKGNKEADKDAKMAVSGTTSDKVFLPRTLKKALNCSKSPQNRGTKKNSRTFGKTNGINCHACTDLSTSTCHYPHRDS
jgi:hypothetical protein